MNTKRFFLALVALMMTTAGYCIVVGSPALDHPLILDVNQFSSPVEDAEEGNFYALLGRAADSPKRPDNDFWHSNWHDGNQPQGTHYFQVEMIGLDEWNAKAAEILANPSLLPKPEDYADYGFTNTNWLTPLSEYPEEIVFKYSRRPATAFDQTTEWSVRGTNDPNAAKDDCEELAQISTPYTSKDETLYSVSFKHKGYKYIRFYSEAQYGDSEDNKNRGYFHLRRFELFPASIIGTTCAFDINTENRTAKVIKKAPAYSGDVVIPSSFVYEGTEYKVTRIGDYAFANCAGLTSVTIPLSVTKIGEKAFWNCDALTSLTIPSSVTSIGARAFANCEELTSLRVEGDNSVYDSRNNCNAVIRTADNTIIAACQTTVIPNTVTGIAEHAFDDVQKITSVTIPASVTNIAESAFCYCFALASIVVEEGNPAYDSRDNCNAIIRKADNALIAGSNNTIIPNTVTSIAGHAFDAREGLTSITIPESVTSIGDCAFNRCTSLTSVTIPEGVTKIGDGAFHECVALTSVTIPSSVNTIDNNAFCGCYGLADMYCYAKTVPNTSSTIFDWSSVGSATLHVLASAVDSYKATAPWSKFGTIVGDLLEKCAKPTIGYKEGQLTFKSATEGVTFHSTITDTDISSYETSTVDLCVTYTIKVYASCDGYIDSEVATATLCWIEVDPKKEGITDDEDPVAELQAVPVLIQADNRQIVVSGVADDTLISVYSINGMQAGSAISQNGKVTIPIQLSGNIAIVKIGDRSVKVVVK